MKREDVPPDMHVAVPTKDNDTLHAGQYAHRCEKCREKMASLARSPEVGGRPVRFGSLVRVKPEHVLSGDPAEVTITNIRVNSYTGEVWLHAFALGENLVLTEASIAEVLSG